MKDDNRPLTKAQTAHLDALRAHGALFRIGFAFRTSPTATHTVKGLNVRAMYRLVTAGVAKAQPLLIYTDGRVVEYVEGMTVPAGDWQSATRFEAV